MFLCSFLLSSDRCNWSEDIYVATDFFFAVSPYDLDGCFSMSALSRLEEAGINVVMSLRKYWKELATKVNVEIHNEEDESQIEAIISRWTSHKPPPTWRDLLDILALENCVKKWISVCLVSTTTVKPIQ